MKSPDYMSTTLAVNTLALSRFLFPPHFLAKLLSFSRSRWLALHVSHDRIKVVVCMSGQRETPDSFIREI